MTISPEFHTQITLAVIAFNGLMFCLLFFFKAPYGRLAANPKYKKWGPIIPEKYAWMLLEFPVFFCFAWFFFNGSHWLNAAPIILFLLWEGHYFHRTFIYPLTLKHNKNVGFRAGIMAFGLPLNAANGFINGWYISELGIHLYSNDWLSDPRFIGGVLLFFAGFSLAKHSEHILKNLRKPDDHNYKIPYGGGFNVVSNPHYLGEALQWTGFAIASWSLPGLAFVLLTLANLVPRAITNHRFYKENFADYPKNRKAIIPFIL